MTIRSILWFWMWQEKEKNCGTFEMKKKTENDDRADNYVDTENWQYTHGKKNQHQSSSITHLLFQSLFFASNLSDTSCSIQLQFVRYKCFIQLFGLTSMCARWHVSYYDLTIRNWVQIDDTFWRWFIYGVAGLQRSFNNKMSNKGHSTEFKYKAVRSFLFVINPQFWIISNAFSFFPYRPISQQPKALFIMIPNLLVKNTNTEEVKNQNLHVDSFYLCFAFTFHESIQFFLKKELKVIDY